MTDQSQTTAAATPRRPPVPVRLAHGFENTLGNVAVLVMAVLPILEIVGRRLLGQGVPGSITWVQHLTLWVAFVGGIIAARDRRHLALATATFLPPAFRPVSSLIASAVGCRLISVNTLDT